MRRASMSFVSVLDRVGAADRIDGVRRRRSRAAMICCVRSAMRADSSVGSASASSRPLQWSDCVPPSTAASAWSATRTMLLSGCCAVSVLPAVCVWKRSCCARGFVAPKRSRMSRAHSRRAARNLAISSRKSLWALKKNDSRWPKRFDVEPGVERRLHVRDRVGEREGDLLDRRRAGFADVIPADRDRVPVAAARARSNAKMSVTIRSDGRGGIDVGAARDVLLEDVVLNRARQRRGGDALPSRDGDVEREQDDRRRVDRHRRRHAVERDAVEELRHVLDRVDRDADAADLARGQRVVGVVAHLRRQVEGDAQAADALREQVAVAPVRLGGGAEPGVLPHRPEPAAVHRRLDAAGEREGARETEIDRRIPARARDLRVGVMNWSCGPNRV